MVLHPEVIALGGTVDSGGAKRLLRTADKKNIKREVPIR
jgi:hypothetical protein